MTYDCYCDDDPPSVYISSTPRARKRYSCEECGSPILPGDHYEKVFGVWDGSAATFRTCERCFDLRTWVRNNVPCLCWMHGDGDTSMREAIADAYHRAPDEVVGLRFGFLRRMIVRDRIKQQKKVA